MVEQIKSLRVQIDGLAQLTKELKPMPCGDDFCHSYETREAVDSLILAKAWLGKVLGELGNPTPYANDGKRKTVEDIEPAADKSTVIEEINKFPEITNTINGFNWYEKNHVEKVDWLRQEIEKLSSYVESDFNYSIFSHTNQTPSREFSIARTKAYSYLCEARFWLGFELSRLRDKTNI
ncbi:MAG TPA: hypothetical protein PKD00_00485 [Burkholderiales bacterium]|nr:hypothetical protein [Burkholderiales bacterium]